MCQALTRWLDAAVNKIGELPARMELTVEWCGVEEAISK